MGPVRGPRRRHEDMNQKTDRQGAQTRTEAIRKAWDQPQTYASMETMLRTLHTKELDQLTASLETVKAYTGLDMRQDATLILATCILKERRLEAQALEYAQAEREQ